MVGSVEAQQQREGTLGSLLLLAHAVGAWFGALLTALALQSIALALDGGSVYVPFTLALMVPAIAAAVGQLAGFGAAQTRWQVPQWWRYGLPPDMTAFFYGSLLGNGMSTAVMVSGFWIFVVSTLVVGTWTAMVGWLMYATTRVIGVYVGLRWKLAEHSFKPTGWRSLITTINGVGVVIGIATLLALVE